MQLNRWSATSVGASIRRSSTHCKIHRCLSRSRKSLTMETGSMQQLDKQANFDAMCTMLGGLDPQGYAASVECRTPVHLAILPGMLAKQEQQRQQ